MRYTARVGSMKDRTDYRAVTIAGVVAATVAFGLGVVIWRCARADGPPRRPMRTPMHGHSLLPTLPLPSDNELARDLAEAVDFRQRETFDRVHDAWDPGELVEHATMTQIALDRGIFGKDALFVVGDELFEYEFRPENGLGNGLIGRDRTLSGALPRPNMRRVHKGAFGGPDSHSCATCHSKGGPDGAGTNTQNALLHGDGVSSAQADERNPPHVLGLGPVQALAREMTLELQSLLDAGLARAREQGTEQLVALVSKGVEFGVLRVQPGGDVDRTGVVGVDEDLIIKPFGWKGHQPTIRAMAEESFRIHLGLISMRVQMMAKNGELDDEARKVYGDGPWYDIDRDGVSMELDSGMLTTMVAYLSQLEVPEVQPPRDSTTVDLFARGSALFAETGCNHCHRRVMTLNNPVIEVRPAQSNYADRAPILINVAVDGEHPKIEPRDARGTAYHVELFSDLKRHDMGPDLATPRAVQGVPASVFLTRPLWGLADTAPYLHDGRAPTVHDAIRLHGGEAQAARAAYLALDERDRAALRVFLMALGRQPKLFVP